MSVKFAKTSSKWMVNNFVIQCSFIFSKNIAYNILTNIQNNEHKPYTVRY